MSFKYPQLRVKIKSLAQESRYIRIEETRRYGKKIPIEIPDPEIQSPVAQQDVPRITIYRRMVKTKHFWDLRAHRALVGVESRATQLALAFLKGRSYAEIEPRCNITNWPDESTFDRIRDIVQKFGVWWDHDRWTAPQYREAKEEESRNLETWISDAQKYIEAEKIAVRIQDEIL